MSDTCGFSFLGFEFATVLTIGEGAHVHQQIYVCVSFVLVVCFFYLFVRSSIHLFFASAQVGPVELQPWREDLKRKRTGLGDWLREIDLVCVPTPPRPPKRGF